MPRPLRLLLVEDVEDEALLTLRALRQSDFEPAVRVVSTPEEMSAALDLQTWDVVISDHAMPRFSAPAALELLKSRGLDVPFIIVTGSMGEEQAVEAMRAGAHDYLVKGRLARLGATIERELREADVRRARREAEERLRRMAYYDRLTDLPNRHRFLDLLRDAIAESRDAGRRLGVLLLSLRGMSDINNTLGRLAGDQLLQKVADRLRGMARLGRHVARIAGHEFTLLAPGADPGRASLDARQILEAFERPLEIEGIAITAHVEIGIAIFPDHGDDAELLLKRADIAASIAQRSATGFELFSIAHDPYSPDRLALAGELRQAIEHDQLVLHYQPVIHLASRRVSGVEALVRWRHPRRGLLAPGEFIEAAESTGLIQPLTRWVLGEAIRTCRSWRQDSVPLTVAVNLSARNLQDAQLQERITGLLRDYGVDPAHVLLEITETTVMADPARATEVLHQLRAMGLRIAIDDFGTGYSSLGYLRRLPVTEVKLDKSLVTGIATSGTDGLIVQSVAELAHHLGLAVIAEGVEDARTLEMLVAANCDAAQGYFLGRPMDAAALAIWLVASPFGLGAPRLRTV